MKALSGNGVKEFFDRVKADKEDLRRQELKKFLFGTAAVAAVYFLFFKKR